MKKYRESLLNMIIGILQAIVLFFGFSTFLPESKLTNIILILLCIVSVVGLILDWYTKTFYFEGNNFILNSGIFNKKTTLIPFEIITSVNISKTFIQRIMNLNTVKINLSNENEDIELILNTKLSKFLQANIMNNINTTSENKIYSLNFVNYLLFSLSFSSLISIIGMSLFYFSTLYNINEVINLSIRDNVLFFIIIYFIFVRASILFWNLIKFYNFKVIQNENILKIEYGLFDKKISTINFDRVSAVSINQSLLQRILKKATISVSMIGTLDDESEGDIVFPVIDYNKIDDIFSSLFCDFIFDGQKENISPKHKLIYHTSNYGLSNDLIYFSKGLINKSSIYIKLNDIDSIIDSQNYINKINDTIKLNVHFIGMKFNSLKGINGIPKQDYIDFYEKLF